MGMKPKKKKPPDESIPVSFMLGRDSAFLHPQRFEALSDSFRFNRAREKTSRAQTASFRERENMAVGVLMRQEFAKTMEKRGQQLQEIITGEKPPTNWEPPPRPRPCPPCPLPYPAAGGVPWV